MRVAVPNKGRLHDPTVELLERAGLQLVDGADRKLYADTVDPEITVLLARAADIPAYVEDGAAAVGITGLDQAREADAELVELLELGYGQCELVLAAPEASAISTVADLEGKTVATEFPRVTRRFFTDRGVEPTIVEVSGATELTPHVDIADAIVDITSTGTTLRMNKLEIVEPVLESSVRLFGRADAANKPKVQQLRTALQSVLAAADKRYLMMNVPEAELETIRAVIPGMGGPTVMNIAGEDDVAVHAVVDEEQVFETIAKLRSHGAHDILVTEIERLVE
ncbi:ATP phosphoribosyltransferase [Halocatena halophila]|uniref:ATP phosphoribosyltransferase n=1 Tax=Halocatena halophila TaxID=2814576 RepID=UPI002ED1DAA6